MEQEAKRLYEAMVRTISDSGMAALLAAGGDLRAKTPFDKANFKTRDIFYCLASNLTGSGPKA